jgi:hypothetical protein
LRSTHLGAKQPTRFYEQLRIGIEAMLSQNKERITAVRLRVLGTSDAHAELNHDLEQVRHEEHSESMLSSADELFDHTQ